MYTANISQARDDHNYYTVLLDTDWVTIITMCWTWPVLGVIGVQGVCNTVAGSPGIISPCLSYQCMAHCHCVTMTRGWDQWCHHGHEWCVPTGQECVILLCLTLSAPLNLTTLLASQWTQHSSWTAIKIKSFNASLISFIQTIKQFPPAKKYRSWQDSNLRSHRESDFESDALTTPPQLRSWHEERNYCSSWHNSLRLRYWQKLMIQTISGGAAGFFVIRIVVKSACCDCSYYLDCNSNCRHS